MKRLVIAAIFILLASFAYCVPPAPGVSPAGMPKDSVHKNTDVSAMIARGAPAWQVAKVITPTGTKKLVVIFVQFSDKTFQAGEVENYENATTGYIKRMKDYISECSYGTFTLNTTLLTNLGSGYTLANTMGYYGINNEALTADGTLFDDACAAAGVTKAGGSYDALMVVHAGQGEESSGTSTDIWSLFSDWSSRFPAIFPSGFTEGETVPAGEAGVLKPFGVLCHEFGHQIGLPDLYNTNTGTSNVGKWDVMDYGAWVANGDNPPHPSTWSKMQIGWISPTIVTSSANVTLNAFDTGSANVFKLPVPGSLTEYFLLEFRRQSGKDSGLPGFGTLIWHIDDSMGTISMNNINNTPTHLRVALEEADKGADVDSNKGDSTDPFKESSLFTIPQSDGYVSPSFITIFDFAGSGSTAMTMRLSLIPATTTLSLTKTFNFPNPVRNAVSTTLRSVFSRPFTSATLKLYTLSGEMVLDVPLTNSNLQQTLSETNGEWTYDYVWNLTNTAGAQVGSGMYLYVVSAEISGEKQVKTGKLAIVR